MIHVCVPVLRRYDMLAQMVQSLRASTIPVDVVHVVNNGRLPVVEGIDGPWKTDVFTPKEAFGVAESWNWFLKHTTDERIIVNDDVLFAPDTIARLLVRSEGLILGCGFSCYVLRDACVKEVGYFDETISPGYAYYEDEDYMTRVLQHKVSAVGIDCGVEHRRSSTLSWNTPDEEESHHRKFRTAQRNYVKKWGGLPGEVRAQFA